MSSHHIVREKQEPALLVLGLDHFDDELLGQLLEWSPTVITTTQTAEKLNAFGIKIDWLISNDAGEDLQSDVKLIPIGEGNLTTTALNYLVANVYPSVNVITDNLELTDYQPFVNQINLVIFHNNQKIFPIHSGFKKWKAGGDPIELLSPVNTLLTSGLKQVKDNRYQTISDGFFSLLFDGAVLFIAEEL